jgi:Cu-Zn family superoxide dismutase
LSAVSAKKAVAELQPDIANVLGKNVSGVITFTQNSEAEKITIKAKITGLAPGSTHGWHIHNEQIKNQNCTTGGGHWNPKNVTHGAPDAEVRHYGDLGNLKADENGVVEVTVTDRLVTLFGDVNALGRGIVIHEKVDDLGLTDAPTSKTVGNAGSRLACANIQLIEEPVSSAGVVPTGYEHPKVTSRAYPEPSKSADTGYGVTPTPKPDTGYENKPAPTNGGGYKSEAKPAPTQDDGYKVSPAPTQADGYKTDSKPDGTILSSASVMAPFLSYVFVLFM